MTSFTQVGLASRTLLLSAVCATALTLATVPALADGPHEGDSEHRRHWYVSAFGGWASALDHKFDFVSNTSGARFRYTVGHDDGYTVGGAVGIVVNPNIRVEAEVAHSKFDYSNNYRSALFEGRDESGSMKFTTVMANIWFNANWGFVSPYVGGGIGAGFTDGSLTVSNGSGRQFSGSDTALALQFGTGLRFPVGDRVELDLGYRLKQIGDVGFASSITGFSTTKDDITTHAVQAGINFKF